MPRNPGYLPQGLSHSACCEFIEQAPLAAWLPVLQQLQEEFLLPKGDWEKIQKGSNALFGLGDNVIVKLVPPNWRRQGDKEILVTPLVDGKLSLQTPAFLGGGEIDNWVFAISSRLDGTSLADVWPSLEFEQKQAIMVQTGQLVRELQTITVEEDIAIQVDWSSYVNEATAACLARHQRRNMPQGLLAQVMPYLQAAGEFAQGGAPCFIHMDIHPWNLMAKQVDGRWTLSGLLDFGDAIVGNSDRFELLTPLMFMAQGDPALVQTLLASYGGVADVDAATLQRQLTACMLIRPDSDVTFCMQQVPLSGPREDWDQVAAQMFPM